MRMKTISTKIIIKAPAAQVWATLTNFSAYAEWNPFIKSIRGQAKEDSSLEVNIQLPDQKPMTFRPQVLRAEVDREFRWRGKTFIKGVFDGEHYFILKPISSEETEFEHGEHFSGVLSGLLMRMIGEGTERGFKAMNQALKERVEANG